MVDGILNLDKPQGWTSHDVVDRVRAVAGQRRVGHAGTLDPLATGVLLVCLGQATRVTEYLMASRKVYRARVRLGITTDTYDADGQVVEQRTVEVDREAVEAALEEFRGRLLQVPPMYSALKRDGQPLHRLARRGVSVERDPRPVEVHRLEMVGWEPPELSLEVACSPGTYVRALAHDLGQALGCGAHLAGLVRLASGTFRVEDALPVDDLTAERLRSALLPVDAALQDHPALHLDEAGARAVRSGRSVDGPPVDGVELLRAYDPDGTFLAVLTYQPAGRCWHPSKVFHPLGR